MDIFLQILDENWLDDTWGRLLYRYGQKCIAIRYLFRVNRGLPVYRYIVAPLVSFLANSVDPDQPAFEEAG